MLQVAESSNFAASFGIKGSHKMSIPTLKTLRGKRAGKGKQGRVAKGNFSHIVL